MEEEFRALLLANAGLSGVAGGRVDWGVKPQGAGLPAVVLNVVSSAETMTMQGPDGLLSSRIQVDCYAATYTGAKTLARAVLAVNGHRGGGFRLVEHVATRDSREGGTNEADRPFRVSLDFLTHWRDEG